MKYSVKLLRVKCNSILSTEDSMWGAADGVRVFMSVFTGGGYHSVYMSGREFPEPDVVDNYFFKPGKDLALDAHPPVGELDWATDAIDVGETTDLWVAVVGLNEGLAYVAGGGGLGVAGKGSLAAMEELAVKMAEKAAEVSSAAAAAVFEVLKTAIEELNQAPDCRGAVFVHQFVFHGTWLFQRHLNQRSVVYKLPLAGAGAQPIVELGNMRISPECGRPDYEVWVEITRQDAFRVTPEDKVVFEGEGAASTLDVKFEPCRPDDGEDIIVWPRLYNRRITFTPSVHYTTLKPVWRVEGTELHNASGTLAPSKEVTFAVDDSQVTRAVRLQYEVLQPDNRLVVTTDGSDGNYDLRVALLMKFGDDQPRKETWEDEIFVEGQRLAGNAAYGRYVECLEHYRKVLTKYAARHQWLRPDTPITRVDRFERDLLELNEALRRGPG